MNTQINDKKENKFSQVVPKLDSSNVNSPNTVIRADNVNVFYGKNQALYDVSIDIQEQEITALIGPSGCGKTSFLRCINRMNDVIDTCSITGQITLNNDDIYAPNIDVVS